MLKSSLKELIMRKTLGRNNERALGFIKTLEISAAFVFFPYVLRSLDIFPVALAYGLGVFIASLIIYWLPPVIHIGIKTWLLISLLIASLVLLYTSMVAT